MQDYIVNDFLHEELRLKLKRLIGKAKSRFSKLSILKGSNWEDCGWLYKGKDKLRLHIGYGASDDLVLLNKVFIVTYLWDRRAATKTLKVGRLNELAFSLRYMAAQGSVNLSDLNQNSYIKAVGHIHSTYKSPAEPCRALNVFARFLFESGLSPQAFDLVGTASLISKDEYGRVAVQEKLPLPDLVKAIISLKWAIQDQWDGSVRAQIDFLAILTQVFQYGLGLRVGEVLRLPKDCLVDINGEMHCRVWTEKGAEPIARYVPTIWRSAIKDAVARINSICQPYRDRAESIENGSLLTQLDERFYARAESIKLEVNSVLGNLSSKVSSNVDATKSRLQLLKNVADDDRIELKRLTEFLPHASTAKGAGSLLKFYKSNGFNVISELVGSFKHAHYVLGRDLKARIKQIIDLRRNTLFYEELFEVLHGRKPSLSRSKDNFAFKGKLKFRSSPSFEHYALTGEHVLSARRAVIVDRTDAVAIVRKVAGGGYDADTYIPVLDAEKLYPEFFNQKTMTCISGEPATGFYSFLELMNKRKNFYRSSPSSSDLKYRIAFGFLIKQSSIKNAVVNSFVASNSKISSELIEEVKAEFLSEGVEISSASFGINQKVSDYLFVVPGTHGGNYNEYIPTILGYYTVLNVIKPTRLGRSAFSRYGVTYDESLVRTFQSHKGRHWQTNSLFRAGLAASIVNKWMGRTDSQGDHYDHQTPRERASKVGGLMLSEQSRFIGDLANKIKAWNAVDIPPERLQSYLNDTLQTVHYGPLGHCFRDINLKPCEFHLKCLTGNAGKGCREFVVDLSDPVQIIQIEAERDRAENELARLFEALNRPNVPTESVEMHIEHQMTVFRNASFILERSDVVLTQDQVEQSQDYQPFIREGSIPSDCMFQCGVV